MHSKAIEGNPESCYCGQALEGQPEGFKVVASSEQVLDSSGGRMPTPGVEPRFYTLEDVATILNVRVAQVYALVRSGDLPAIKLGGRGVWRVDRIQLEEYIERMHAKTREWALAHPLSSSPEED
jgi:excisionase family DNA binding protein